MSTFLTRHKFTSLINQYLSPQGGRTRASDAFVKMLMHSDFALAASNDIRNATGRDKKLDLAVVFFTNRVMGSAVRSPIVTRTIELARDRLDEYQRKLQAATKAAMGMGFHAANVSCSRSRLFTYQRASNFATTV